MTAWNRLTRWMCVVVLALVVAFSVAACAVNSSPTNPGSNPTPSHGGY
jgi:hypothetical protein